MPEKALKKKRGGNVKKAPPGFYTARQAQDKLGLNSSTFSLYVRQGKIKRYVTPPRKEGYYKRKEIDRLATKWALILTEDEIAETRIALPQDAEGIVKILTDMGWKTTTVEQLRSWYEVNPSIDFVAIFEGEIAGYIRAAPFVPSALSGMMSGKKRAWDLTAQDILPYKPGNYSLYVGIATRKNIENHEHHLGFRLISGFMAFLEELAEQGIIIQRMYAISDQPDGQKLCRKLGFAEQEAEEGDRFPRYMLDLEFSDSHFAKLYREAIQTIQQE